MIVLKGNFYQPQKIIIFDKNYASFTFLDYVILEREFSFAVLNKCFLKSFKTVILSLWSSFIVEVLGWSKGTFLFTVASNLCPNKFTAEKVVFTIFYFQSCKKSTCNSYFPVFIVQFLFLIVLQDVFCVF